MGVKIGTVVVQYQINVGKYPSVNSTCNSSEKNNILFYVSPFLEEQRTLYSCYIMQSKGMTNPLYFAKTNLINRNNN